MFWNGSQNAGELGSIAAVARSGKNGVIHSCGRPTPNRRTPKSRFDDTVIQNSGSWPGPVVCANGAQRPHELVRPRPWLAVASWIGGAEPSALTTHSEALALLYEEPLSERL